MGVTAKTTRVDAHSTISRSSLMKSRCDLLGRPNRQLYRGAEEDHQRVEGKSADERKAKVKEIKEKIDALNKAQEALLESLQKQFTEGKEKTEKAIAEIAPEMRLIKGMDAVGKGGKEEL